MSRIGKLPIDVPDGVSLKIDDAVIAVSGPKGELRRAIPPEVKVKQEDKNVIVERMGETKKHLSFHGLYRSLICNMIEGVSKGFQKNLEIQGVGYTAELKGKNIVLNLGFSHAILFKPPGEITIEVPSRNSIVVSGIDKQVVGDVAAKLRAFRPPEPYKGKGIRYLGEEVQRKVGKTSG
ncbi:50S ribosomal protein L6 [candidate division KSB1 bacterium]